MNLEDEREVYLGDGLYALFDGWQFRLRAPREHGDHVVFLEPHVMEKFLTFVASTAGDKAAH
jgi:hypothetical protein